MKVAIVGAAGMLGTSLVSAWRDQGVQLSAVTRADLDVTDAKRVLSVVKDLNPDVLVNCSAYNLVDDAEVAPATALAVNAWAVKHLARASADVGATFVHYSTDFVFDGFTDRPYVEDDAPNPQGAYGVSKLLGEWMAADVERHYVVRVESLFGGRASRSTLDRMLENLTNGRTVTAFSDRVVSPSYVPDVVNATLALVNQRAPFGLYHCVNSGWATWLEVAQELARLAGASPAGIQAVKAADLNLRARRPAFAALSNARLASLGIALPHWSDALSRHLHA